MLVRGAAVNLWAGQDAQYVLGVRPNMHAQLNDLILLLDLRLARLGSIVQSLSAPSSIPAIRAKNRT